MRKSTARNSMYERTRSSYELACKELSIFCIAKETFRSYNEIKESEKTRTFLVVPSVFYRECFPRHIKTEYGAGYSIKHITDLKGFIPEEHMPFNPHKIIRLEMDELLKLYDEGNQLLHQLLQHTKHHKSLCVYFTNGARDSLDLETLLYELDFMPKTGISVSKIIKRM